MKVYLDGALIHTGTSLEDYYRDNEGGVTRPVDSIMFRVAGTAVPADSGNGFLIDNFSSLSGPVPPADQPITLPLTGVNSAHVSDSAGLDFSLSGGNGNVSVSIPAGTNIQANGTWDGTINPPAITTVSIPDTSGFTTTMGLAISVGSDSVTLTFNQGVRLILPGQAGKHVGFIIPSGSFTEITTTCSSDDQTVGDNLPGGGACKIEDVGGNLIVWTKHFTKFASYSQTVNPTPSAITSTPAATTPVKAQTYTVVSGDTLSGIGTAVGVDWQLIASTNGITAPYTIYPGQVLQLPAGSTTPSPASAASASQTAGSSAAVLGAASNPQIGTAVSTVVSKPAVVASTAKKANWLNWYWFAAGAAVALLAVIYYIYRAADKKS